MKNRRGHIIRPRSQVPQVIVGLFALAGLAALVATLSIFSPAIQDFVQQRQVANDNRTWLTREWTQIERSPEDVADLAAMLKDNRIASAYLQTGSWHGLTGDYIELPYNQTFQENFYHQTAQIPLYAWITIPFDKLMNANARQQVISFAQHALSEQGFIGVHLQARAVPNENEEFIDLLRNLRRALGQQAVISITVPPDRTPLDPSIPSSPISLDNLTWSQEYKRRVLLHVDEVVLMGHASSLTDADDYELWLAYQVATYAEIIHKLGIELRYIIALPTYAAELGHDPEVENVETALAGVKRGITRARDAGGQIDGVGLYPWDQTDLFELDAYWTSWANR